MFYSNRYDYILEAVETAEQLEEIHKMSMEDKIINDWVNITQEIYKINSCTLS
jgi:ribonucleotide reductase beta subunit family protein with ferritin-like domain